VVPNAVVVEIIRHYAAIPAQGVPRLLLMTGADVHTVLSTGGR